MNRNLLTPLITVLAAGLVAFGVTRWTARAAPGPSLEKMQKTEWLARELHLGAAQMESLRALQNSYSTQLEDCCERHCSARFEIGADLFKPDWTAEKQVELSEELCHAQRDSEIATLEHIRQVHSLLTPGQQKQYEELVTSCICAECPNDLHTK